MEFITLCAKNDLGLFTHGRWSRMFLNDSGAILRFWCVVYEYSSGFLDTFWCGTFKMGILRTGTVLTAYSFHVILI